jgi:hypothetical protein
MKVLFATLVVACATSAVSAATPFDGSWAVTQTCPPTAQDVRGYQWAYGATIRNGMLSGSHNPSGPGDGSVRLTGRISPDGDAVLSASGQTGRPEFSVGHVAQGYRFHYTFPARFTGSSGTGTRTQQRTCEFNFTRN